MENSILVKGLTKKYKKSEKPAVDNISFDVKKGQFFALLGPNGAGKTTTISILTTTLSKTAGQVVVGGYDLDKEESKIRSHIGVIFQKPSLDLNLTAEENIRFHVSLYGLFPFRPSFSLMPKAYQEKVHELASILSIEDSLSEPVKTFSGGMKRKLEIVRSLTHKPSILFLDEPTSGLDPESRKSLWKYLSEVKKETNTTIFLTTHYLEEAETADKVVIIGSGKIIAEGTPGEIKKNIVKEYLAVDAKKKEALKAELKKQKIKFTENGVIQIPLNGKSPQKIIQTIKTPLSYLDIHIPTLEEAYLEVLNKSNNQKNDK